MWKYLWADRNPVKMIFTQPLAVTLQVFCTVWVWSEGWHLITGEIIESSQWSVWPLSTPLCLAGSHTSTWHAQHVSVISLVSRPLPCEPCVLFSKPTHLITASSLVSGQKEWTPDVTNHTYIAYIKDRGSWF